MSFQTNVDTIISLDLMHQCSIDVGPSLPSGGSNKKGRFVLTTSGRNQVKCWRDTTKGATIEWEWTAPDVILTEPITAACFSYSDGKIDTSSAYVAIGHSVYHVLSSGRISDEIHSSFIEPITGLVVVDETIVTITELMVVLLDHDGQVLNKLVSTHTIIDVIPMLAQGQILYLTATEFKIISIRGDLIRVESLPSNGLAVGICEDTGRLAILCTGEIVHVDPDDGSLSVISLPEAAQGRHIAVCPATSGTPEYTLIATVDSLIAVDLKGRVMFHRRLNGVIRVRFVSDLLPMDTSPTVLVVTDAGQVSVLYFTESAAYTFDDNEVGPEHAVTSSTHRADRIKGLRATIQKLTAEEAKLRGKVAKKDAGSSSLVTLPTVQVSTSYVANAIEIQISSVSPMASVLVSCPESGWHIIRSTPESVIMSSPATADSAEVARLLFQQASTSATITIGLTEGVGGLFTLSSFFPTSSLCAVSRVDVCPLHSYERYASDEPSLGGTRVTLTGAEVNILLICPLLGSVFPEPPKAHADSATFNYRHRSTGAILTLVVSNGSFSVMSSDIAAVQFIASYLTLKLSELDTEVDQDVQVGPVGVVSALKLSLAPLEREAAAQRQTTIANIAAQLTAFADEDDEPIPPELTETAPAVDLAPLKDNLIRQYSALVALRGGAGYEGRLRMLLDSERLDPGEVAMMFGVGDWE
ncbi:hypothetical protein J8273_4692 [Carpediemonas membranifera]|uniref:Uncharacterized protein n=1 Tax=Carpediemonas membranifera TaxID=201153 RepID=A0A8J6B3Z8_9EUKA|nr:hypothetical protein J8273_4692 [Carpediemonas membranifera]|eukprot:KAG9393829.1 hypothetical protein J8273_4692 [Carpediemonas membranifera]